MIQFISEHDVNLWGEHRGRYFTHQCVYLWLFHDLEKKGYCWLSSQTKPWMKLTHTSIHHNTQKIRESLRGWANDQIQIGTRKDWIAAARKVKLPKKVCDTELWIDSTDVGLTGKKTISRKDPKWSFNEIAPDVGTW